VHNLRERGHEVLAASMSSGVNVLTGEGIAEAVAGAPVVVDVTNSPSFEDAAALKIFETSGQALETTLPAANIAHIAKETKHVALSGVR
jgi:hypothetical protein